jgi:hypothetical protein
MIGSKRDLKQGILGALTAGFNAKVLHPIKAGFNKLIAHGVIGGVRSRLSMGDFFKPCPSRAKAGFKKSPSG